MLEVSCYDSTTNAGVDVLAITAGGAAFESAIPPAMRVLDEGYVPMDDVRSRAKAFADSVIRLWLCETLKNRTGCIT